jgi:hypothetical protein
LAAIFRINRNVHVFSFAGPPKPMRKPMPNLMPNRRIFLALPLVLAAPALALWRRTRPKLPDAATQAAAYGRPLPPPDLPQRVFHLGHSLVGRDMPAMLAQLAGAGHRYDSQIGQGTSLQQHWEPDLPILGFEAENDHPRFRPAKAAIGSGDYDAVVLTEMVEIADAIKYFDSARYLTLWADLARAGSPKTQVYLYETWHWLDDPGGWLARLDADLPRYWEAELALRDLAVSGPERPIRIIPAGQVLARFVRALDAAGGIDDIRGREDLFAREPGGRPDRIHMGDLGNYLVALTHFAVLYRRAPVGLPHRLRRADGTLAKAPGIRAARLMQETVWSVVTTYSKTGVAA